MSEIDAAKYAGDVLRRLIKENYPSQEEFAFEYGADVRTINRYVNLGITKVPTIQSFAMHFNVSIKEFFPD